MSIAAKKVMNYTLTHNYGRQRLVTDSWNYTQKKLRCCGVDDMSWEVYDNSYWDRFTNANEADRNKKIPKTSPFYRFVPISCCWTLIDPRTTWPTDTYRDVGRCQHWQFGPPNHKTGAFNDALYSRVRASVVTALYHFKRGVFRIFVQTVNFLNRAALVPQQNILSITAASSGASQFASH